MVGTVFTTEWFLGRNENTNFRVGIFLAFRHILLILVL